MLEGKRILITGGAGFIGSNLAHRLCGSNDVIVLDNLSLGRMENLKGADVEFIKDDITALHSIDGVGDLDIIFHLAAIPGVQQSIDDPLGTVNINVMGTLNMLEFARRHDATFIFASTCAIYGTNMALPLREDSNPAPLSPYASGKLACEYFIKNYNEIYGLQTCAFRMFSVYGPRQDPHSPYAAVVPRFIKACLSNTPPVIYGDGTQTRDFVYVKDVTRALEMAASIGAEGVMNIGTGREYSVIELLDIIKKVTGYNGNVRFEPPRSGEALRSRADISRIKKALGWQPEYTLDMGIRETVEWFRR